MFQPCVPSMPVPGDGIDNDCDGRIDEELEDSIGNIVISPVARQTRYCRLL